MLFVGMTLLLVGCFSYIPTKQEVLIPHETGPEKRCIPGVEGQCFCRQFDGTKFLDGLDERECGEDGACPQCIYR